MYRETREWSTEEYWYVLRLGSLDWWMYTPVTKVLAP